ncbi:hypothetical protein PTKIN_Ptkin14bG0102400 [Pterospermum kingtungense]
MPHEEEVEVVNVGTEESIKELRIGTPLIAEIREGLITLLREYTDVFDCVSNYTLG